MSSVTGGVEIRLDLDFDFVYSVGSLHRFGCGLCYRGSVCA